MSVKVLAYTHPLRDTQVEAEVADGQTIREIVGAAPVHAWINGREVPAGLLDRTRPKPGATLVVRPVPQGDFFSNPLNIALFAIMPAFAIANYSILQAVENRLFPPQLPHFDASTGNDSFNRLAAITGTSNQVAAFKPIPRLYGEFRFYPPIPMTGTPYTELSGSDQYLRMIVVLGYGPLQIGGVRAGAGSPLITEQTTLTGTPIKIGDTSIDLFDDVEFQVGDPADITLYSNEIIETQPAWTTKADTDGYNTDSGSQWVADGGSAIRTTDTDASEISLDVTFNSGLFSINSQGKTTLAKVDFKIEYRAVGASTWTTVANPWTLSSTKRETFRAAYRWKVTKGQYEVQLTRIRTWHNDFEAVADECTWTALRTIRTKKAFVVPDTVVMALRIRATDQLDGQLDDLSIEATSLLPVWNGSTWVEQVTRAPAWIYADILTGTANGDPLDKSKLDTDSLAAWASETEAAGRHYDGIFDDNATVFARIQEVATTGRASFSLSDTAKVGVVLDTAQSVPKMVISPRNSFNFSSTLSFDKPPHAYRAQFVDPDTYENTERLVFDDGYDESNATKFEVLQTKGVKSADQAWKEGRYHLAQLRLRPETFTFSQDIQHLRYRRGDLLALRHDVILIGLGAGRVKSITVDDDGNVTSFECDEKLFMEPSKSYAVKMQKADGSISTVGISTVSPYTQSVTLASATSGIAAGDHFVFGEAGSETIDVKVSAIDPSGDFIAKITCVPAVPEILDAETGAIPDYRPVITKPIDVNSLPPPKPSITHTRSDESAMIRDIDGSYRIALMVFASLPSFPGSHTLLQARIKNQNDSTGWQLSPQVDAGAGVVSIADVQQGATYDIQVRAVREGKASAWSDTASNLVIGKATPPPNVVSLTLSQNGTATVMRWSQVEVLDLKGYELRYMSQNQTFNWDLAKILSEITRGTQVTTALLPPGKWFIGIKSVDTAGNYSVLATVSGVQVTNDFDAVYAEEQSTASPAWPGDAQGFQLVNGSWIINSDFASDDLSSWTFDETMTYLSTDGAAANGCIELSGDAWGNLTTKNYFPIDPQRTYFIMGSFKVSATSSLYAGIACYDSQKQLILGVAAWRDNNKDTTTWTGWGATTGDSTIDIIPPAEDWFAPPNSYIQFDIVDDGSDLPAIGRTYQVTNIDKAAGSYWRLTLSSPLTRSYAPGTKVGNSYDPGSYTYALAAGDVGTNWVTRSATLTGSSGPFDVPSTTKFRFGTSYIRYIVLHNTGSQSGIKSYVDDAYLYPNQLQPSDGFFTLKLSGDYYLPGGQIKRFINFGDGQNAGDDPAGWRMGWTGGAWQIVTDDAITSAGFIGASNGRCAEMDAGQATGRANALLLEVFTEQADIEIVARCFRYIWQYAGAQGFFQHNEAGVALRATSIGYPPTGYYARESTYWSDTRVYANTTQLASSSSLGDFRGKWSLIRMRVQGTTIQYKQWLDADTEPDWQITLTDSTLSAGGYIGLVNAMGRTYWDWIGIATGGGTAPMEPVPSSGALAIYTAPFLDAGFVDTVRVWGEVQATAPTGQLADPKLQVRTAIGLTGDLDMWSADSSTLMWNKLDSDPMWQAWGDWEDWSVGMIEAQLVQHRIVYDPANGDPTITGFLPVVDVLPRSEGQSNVSVPASGLSVLFSKLFHKLPLIKLTSANAANFVSYSNRTTSGFTINVYNASGTAVAGTVDWQASTG